MIIELKQILGYLKEPYPYYYGTEKRLFILLLLLSILSFSFSFFFEPFDVNVVEHKINSTLIMVVHASIPLPIAYIYFRIIDKRLKDDTTWTLGKEIFHLSSILFILGIVGFLIRDFIYTNPDNWSFQYFWEEIRNTFLVGLLLVLIVLPLNLERLIKKHTSSIKKLKNRTTLPVNKSSITIENKVSDESFQLHIENFIFAKVESNYTEIFTSTATGVHKQLIRITLKELEEQLKSMPTIFKTHRSYLVNINAIDFISGNAQGYQLSLKNCAIKIPVSRSNIAGFNAVYSKVE